MSGQTRRQEYKYQYKTLAVARTTFCGYGPTMSVSIPDNLLELKNLCVHASLVFDSSVSAPNRVLHWIGGGYNMDPAPANKTSDEQPRMMHISEAADANRRVDVTIDLSHLIDQLEFDTSGSFDQPSFELGMITDPTNNNSVTGALELWKVDMIYTTKGIQ